MPWCLRICSWRSHGKPSRNLLITTWMIIASVAMPPLGPTHMPATAIAPSLLDGIEPSPILQTANQLGVRSTTGFAPALGTIEPHTPAEFFPVWRIEGTQLTTDRHRSFLGS